MGQGNNLHLTDENSHKDYQNKEFKFRFTVISHFPYEKF